MTAIPVYALVAAAGGLILPAGAQTADPAMERYSRAWALSGQTSTLTQGIDQLQAIIESRPGFWRAYKTLAHAYVVARVVGQGEAFFQKRTGLDAFNACPNFGLGMMFYEAHRYREAVEQLTLCVKKNPGAVACHFALPDAMRMLLKRPATLQDLRARFQPSSDEAASCVGILRAYAVMRNMPALEQELGTCLEAARASDDPDFEQYVLLNDARGDLVTSIRQAEKDLRRAEGRGDVEYQCKALSELGEWTGRLGRFLESQAYLNRALAIGRGWGAQQCLRQVLTASAAVHKSRNQNEQAIQMLTEAFAAAKNMGDAAAFGSLAREVGIAYRSTGQSVVARKWLEEAFIAVRSVQERDLEAFLLRDLAMVDADAGNYWKALERMQQAARIFHDLGMSYPEGATIGHLPMIYGPLGDYDAALRTARQGLQSAYANQDPLMEQRILEHIGTIYLRLGRPGEALPYLEKSVALTPRTKAANLHTNALLSLGEAYAGTGRPGKAVAALEEGLAEARKMGRPAAEAQALDLLGEFRLKGNQPAEASAHFERSLAIAERIRVPQLALGARLGLARVASRTNRPEEAWLHLKPALEAMESVRAKIPTPDLRERFAEQNAAAYEAAIDALASLGRDREALLVAERARARAFLDLLFESKANLRRGLTAEQERERQRLEANVSQALAALSKADTAPNQSWASKAETELAAWEESARLRSPEYAAARYPQPYTPEQAQRLAADRGLAILQFALGEHRSHAWVITGAAIRRIELPPRDQIEPKVGAFRARMTRPSPGDLEGVSRPLYSMLLAPAEPMLAGARRILIVPDGILHYLPFEALSPRRGRFLVEDFTIGYAPSVSVFGSLRAARKSRPYDLLAYGDPVFSASEAVEMRSVYRAGGISLSRLPNTKTEVESIGRLFPAAREKLRLGPEATEASVKAEKLGAYRLLHFATHAVIDERAPARSGIVLSLVNTGREDGILRTGEIFNLNLNADLVTLSACRTGLGPIVRGEGMIGLTRAILSAGSSRVLVSLWEVNDVATPAMMRSFYAHLSAGKDAAEALREAKIAMIHSDRPAHRLPHFWAPFIMSGAF